MLAVPVAADRLFDADVCGDPYPLYRELLADGPVVRGPSGWLVGGYDAVTTVLRDARFGHEVRPPREGETREERIARRIFITQNPPEHTYLRGLVSKAFTPRTVAALRPSIAEMVDDLLDHMPGGDTPVDLLAAFAAPLPVAVISEMLGIPEPDRPAFRQWSEDLVLPDGPVGQEPERQQRWRDAGRHFADYLTELVADRRRSPGEDLVSKLVEASDGDPRFGLDDLLATCQLLLFAGHETTVNLLANGVLALLRNPGELALLRAERDDPRLVASAVEEFLRYDGPVHLTARTAVSTVELGGQTIAEGDYVIVLLGAANRDPARFADPDRLDLLRERNQHVGFGVGIHYCLGAPLARLEAQIALPELLERAPGLALACDDADLTWRHSLMLRGLDALPVTLGGT